jgi:glucosamine--fructose-6-phosphate aminotransferase (isomerizing)
MCGIVAVLRRPATRAVPVLPDLLEALASATAELGGAGLDDLDRIASAASTVERVDTALRGVPGVKALCGDPVGAGALRAELKEQHALLGDLEARLDADGASIGADRLETLNAALIRLKDTLWSVERDRLRTAASVTALGAGALSEAGYEGFTSVQTVLSAIDRLEVRGRDSAGVQLFVTRHALDLDDPAVRDELVRRRDSLFRSDAVLALPTGALCFVYKAAAEIGELGDNVAKLRDAITNDDLLHRALANDTAEVVVLGHTRWASVGIISEANAHPLNAETSPDGADAAPYVAAALNGDVDNFVDLVGAHALSFPPEITTDAKVIPTLVARGVAGGASPLEAFRETVASFEGSVAIGAHVAAEPDRLMLALRGSGQALYVGLAEDAYVVASEPYGLVEETSEYLRLDGETPGNPQNPGASRGQIVSLDAARAGTVEGIDRRAYDGTPLPVTAADLVRAQITTRDIDRGPYPHFLLKEISEAPGSFRKTLRGKIVERDGRLEVDLGETVPDALRAKLAAREIRRVTVIGQGTAAVAGQSLADALRRVLGYDGEHSAIVSEAVLATELSGFRLRADMSDTLVVAISQSGTTTDTNRTVDLVRARGGTVISIVNRRSSDLVDRSDGVLYTSDGRDVEMSVASTKAFYAQVAAGFLLSFALADALGVPDDDERQRILRGLRALPDALQTVLAKRPEIEQIALRQAPSRRYWAVVGNGANRVAANEIRIKLSELCYKSIACDATEDKKHIDLSSEPMIVVCAAGMSGSNADDVAKELAIYRAHKAAPIAIVDEGEERFGAALETITVPAVHPPLAFVVAAMAGHLLCYEAALAIDASALPLREARAAIEDAAARLEVGPERVLEALTERLEAPAARFFDGLRAGAYDGSLEAATAVQIASLFRYATSVLPLDAFQVEYGRVGTPGTVVDDLTSALTHGIEELTRPIDAIKHQAKTVTVGISRSDETLLRAALVHEVLAAGATRDGLSYRVLRTLVDLDPAVRGVIGFTRYRIDGDPESDEARIGVVDRGGIAMQLQSRTDRNPSLRDTKATVAVEREVFVTRGRSDGRNIMIVPEVKSNQTVGLVLLHLDLEDHLGPDVARGVLQGYRHRYTALRGAVTETEPSFDDSVLAEVPVVDLLVLPISTLADRWRRRSA